MLIQIRIMIHAGLGKRSMQRERNIEIMRFIQLLLQVAEKYGLLMEEVGCLTKKNYRL